MTDEQDLLLYSMYCMLVLDTVGRPTEYTEVQLLLSGVHSIMRVKSVLAGEGGGARPPPLITFTLSSKVAVYAPAEWADTLTLFHLYQYVYSEGRPLLLHDFYPLVYFIHGWRGEGRAEGVTKFTGPGMVSDVYQSIPPSPPHPTLVESCYATQFSPVYGFMFSARFSAFRTQLK